MLNFDTTVTKNPYHLVVSFGDFKMQTKNRHKYGKSTSKNIKTVIASLLLQI